MAEAEIQIPEVVDKNAIYPKIHQNTKISQDIIEKTIHLLETGNTVPFIARYRKEVTKDLDETQIRDIKSNLDSIVSLEERKISILQSIQSQNKLTEQLKKQILKGGTLQEIEDIYLPFKKRIKTLGTKAKDKGLEPLANLIREGKIKEDNDASKSLIEPFLSEEKEVNSIEEALSGAIDIIAEDFAYVPENRELVRKYVNRSAILKAKVDEDILSSKEPVLDENGKQIDPQKFENYFKFTADNKRVKYHQLLAIQRAEKFGIIKRDFDTPDENILHELKKQNEITNNSYYADGASKGFKRYMIRSLKRELWNTMKGEAFDHAITVFGTNLKNLLLTPPLKGKAIIGLDPGYRTGCKVAVIDKMGKYLDNAVIYPTPPKNQKTEAKRILKNLTKKYDAPIFAIGNGTASQETEQLVSEMINSNELSAEVAYEVVNEAGASIYSASPLAKEEFPDLDLTVRGAISIARRLQDPLSELIKIDPKSIGIGLYQHDVNQIKLKNALDAVIEDCVNSVGVDLNTASSKLLEYVSGIGASLAKKITAHRKENGAFTNRKEIKSIRGLGAKTFEQCAGFLKIPKSENPLDRTFIHPESYKITEKILKKIGLSTKDLLKNDPEEVKAVQEKLFSIKPKSTAQELGVEPDKIRYLIKMLVKPNLDPRDKLQKKELKKKILTINDLKEGMIVKGIIRNVVDFGAFVDIGVKYNGLVHKSQIANKYVNNPQEYLSIGDVMDMKITSIDTNRNRIQLSIKDV